MSTNPAGLSSFSDASAILFAAVSGDDDAVQTIVQQIALSDNARTELAAALAWTIHAAAAAIKRELDAAAERGDDQCAAVEYLAAASQYAHTTAAKGEGRLDP